MVNEEVLVIAGGVVWEEDGCVVSVGSGDGDAAWGVVSGDGVAKGDDTEGGDGGDGGLVGEKCGSSTCVAPFCTTEPRRECVPMEVVWEVLLDMEGAGFTGDVGAESRR